MDDPGCPIDLKYALSPSKTHNWPFLLHAGSDSYKTFCGSWFKLYQLDINSFFISHFVKIIWLNEPLRGVSCFLMLITSTLLVLITKNVVYVHIASRNIHRKLCVIWTHTRGPYNNPPNLGVFCLFLSFFAIIQLTPLSNRLQSCSRIKAAVSNKFSPWATSASLAALKGPVVTVTQYNCNYSRIYC